MKIFIALAFAWLLFSGSSAAGVKVYRAETPEMPLQQVALYFPFGTGTEGIGEEGITLLVNRWMGYGTEKRTMGEFDGALLELGGIIDTRISTHYTLVTIEAPSDKFLKAWQLALEKIRSPKLATEDLETVKRAVVSAKKDGLANWQEAVGRLVSAAVYAGKPEGKSSYGIERSLLATSADKARKYYAATFGKGPSMVIASRNLPAKSESIVLQSIAGWESTSKPTKPVPHYRKGRHLIIVDRPGSSQAYLAFGKAGPTPGSDDHTWTAIATQMLGSNGGNSSILFDELRAKRGLTYHASISTETDPEMQMIFGITFGSNENITELASRYLSEWEKFHSRSDIKDRDLEEGYLAYKSARDRDAGETISAVIRTAAKTLSVTGDIKTIWTSPRLSKEAFYAAKKKWLEPSGFTLVVLGDPSKVKDGLEKAVKPTSKTVVLPANADWDLVSEAVLKTQAQSAL
jgi:zinc protease